MSNITAAVESAARANGLDMETRTRDRQALAQVAATVEQRAAALSLKSALNKITIECGSEGVSYGLVFDLVPLPNAISTSVAQMSGELRSVPLGHGNRCATLIEVFYDDLAQHHVCRYSAPSTGQQPKRSSSSSTAATARKSAAPRKSIVKTHTVVKARGSGNNSRAKPRVPVEDDPDEYDAAADATEEPAAATTTTSSWWNPLTWFRARPKLSGADEAAIAALEFQPTLLTTIETQ